MNVCMGQILFLAILCFGWTNAQETQLPAANHTGPFRPFLCFDSKQIMESSLEPYSMDDLGTMKTFTINAPDGTGHCHTLPNNWTVIHHVNATSKDEEVMHIHCTKNCTHDITPSCGPPIKFSCDCDECPSPFMMMETPLKGFFSGVIASSVVDIIFRGYDGTSAAFAKSLWRWLMRNITGFEPCVRWIKSKLHCRREKPDLSRL